MKAFYVPIYIHLMFFWCMVLVLVQIVFHSLPQLTNAMEVASI